MSRTALITGITGQDGSYLAELLLAKGYEVHGVVRRSSNDNCQRIHHLERCHPLTSRRPDRSAFADAVGRGRASRRGLQPGRAEFRTDQLAATDSDRRDDRTWCDARSWRRFGLSIDKSDSIKPAPARCSAAFRKRRSAKRRRSGRAVLTAVAKVYGHWITVNYRESFDLFACSGILFNHESPRRGTEFVTRKITRTVAQIKLGLGRGTASGESEGETRLGLCGRLCRSDVVDASAGNAQRLRRWDRQDVTKSKQFVSAAFEHVNLDWHDYVVIDPKFYRPAEVDLLVADSDEGKRELGWEPKVSFRELVAMMVDADSGRFSFARPCAAKAAEGRLTPIAGEHSALSKVHLGVPLLACPAVLCE